MFSILLLAVIAVTCSLGEANHQSKCMPPIGKMHFDENKFSGEWFVVGRILTNIPADQNVQCSKVKYSVKENGNTTHINMDLHTIVDGKEVNYVSTGQPINHWLKSVLHAAWKKDSDDKWMSVMLQSILATDYTNFAIFYACKPLYIDSVDVFSKIEAVQIWSKKPEMEPKLLEVLKNVLSGYNFNVEDMTPSDNSKC